MHAKRFLTCLLLAMAALPSWAQRIDVSITIAFDTFIIGEPVQVQADLQNVTTRAFLVNDPASKNRFFFEVSRGGAADELPTTLSGPATEPFLLSPGKLTPIRMSVDRQFHLTEEGSYFVRAVIVHDGVRYESPRKTFDVVPGIPVKKGLQMFTRREKLSRKFTLVYWERNRARTLFLRIEDEPTGRVWDTIDLGLYLRETEPKLDIAPNGEVTVIHKSTQDAYIRTKIWSLEDTIEIVERGQLLDPQISASDRMRTLYKESLDEKSKENSKKSKSWWKFW